MKFTKKNRSAYLTKTALLVFCLLSMQSCILVPFINSFKQLGATKSDRKVLLEKDIKGFTTALRAEQYDVALAYVADEYKVEFKNLLRSRQRSERIVDLKVDMFDLSEDVRLSQVDVLQRYYQIPYYVVKDRILSQHWKFQSGLWRLYGQEEILKNN